MLGLSASVCIDAPAAVVWDQLARLEDIQLWSEPSAEPPATVLCRAGSAPSALASSRATACLAVAGCLQLVTLRYEATVENAERL